MSRLLIVIATLSLFCSACTSEPQDLNLVGNRFAPLTWDEMTDAQKTMVTNILAGPRERVSGAVQCDAA